MKVLRTPEERFANLPGYAFKPHYVELPDTEGGMLRMHYVDEGPSGGPAVLLLHGEPSWSYLYRKMIGPLAARGCRVIAPDLIGFGRSDKPAARTDYTYQRHVDWVRGLLNKLALKDITLFCQDWGGLIGLRLVGEEPDRFARVVAANTMLPTGDHHPGQAFLAWQKFSQEIPQLPVGNLIRGGCARPVTPEVIAAYDAPFPDETYKEGARQFPMLVPVSPDDPAAPANRKAWEGLASFRKPFLTAFSDKDPITKGAEKVLQENVAGAKGQPHRVTQNAGHFLQEDAGEELARVILEFMGRE